MARTDWVALVNEPAAEKHRIHGIAPVRAASLPTPTAQALDPAARRRPLRIALKTMNHAQRSAAY